MKIKKIKNGNLLWDKIETPFGLFYLLEKYFSPFFSSVDFYIRVKYIL